MMFVEIASQPIIDTLDPIVAELVQTVDGALDVCDLFIANIGAAGNVFLMP